MRKALVLSLVGVLLAGPWLCCCTTVRLSAFLTHSSSATEPQTAPSTAASGCCCCQAHPVQQPQPDRPRDSHPAKEPPCPCREGAAFDALATQARGDVDPSADRPEKATFDLAPADLDAFSADVLVLSDDPMQRGNPVALSPRALLRLLHVLRC
jgi:hypothetical protein